MYGSTVLSTVFVQHAFTIMDAIFLIYTIQKNKLADWLRIKMTEVKLADVSKISIEEMHQALLVYDEIKGDKRVENSFKLEILKRIDVLRMFVTGETNVDLLKLFLGQELKRFMKEADLYVELGAHRKATCAMDEYIDTIRPFINAAIIQHRQ